MELWVSNNMMKLFSFLYITASHTVCKLFVLRVYIVSCRICITFLNMLPSIVFTFT